MYLCLLNVSPSAETSRVVRQGVDTARRYSLMLHTFFQTSNCTKLVQLKSNLSSSLIDNVAFIFTYSSICYSYFVIYTLAFLIF